MDREKLFKVLNALELSIADAEAYVAHRLNTPISTPLTLVYNSGGGFIYESQYNPAFKDCFVGFCVDNTIFYAQMFRCNLAPHSLRLEKIDGQNLNTLCKCNLFPKNAFLATSREKNIVYKHQKEWNETVRILTERHIKMFPVKKIGGNIFEDKDRGKLQIYCAATNEYHDIDGWRERGTMMICSGCV